MLIKIFPQVVANHLDFENCFIPTEQGNKLTNLVNELIKSKKNKNMNLVEYKSELIEILRDMVLIPSGKQFSITTNSLKEYIKKIFPFIKETDYKEEENTIILEIPEELIKYIEYHFAYQKLNV